MQRTGSFDPVHSSCSSRVAKAPDRNTNVGIERAFSCLGAVGELQCPVPLEPPDEAVRCVTHENSDAVAGSHANDLVNGEQIERGPAVACRSERVRTG